MNSILLNIILFILYINIINGELSQSIENSNIFDNTESTDLSSSNFEIFNSNHNINGNSIENTDYSDNTQSSIKSNDFSTDLSNYETIGEVMNKNTNHNDETIYHPEINDYSLSNSKSNKNYKQIQKTISIKNLSNQYTKEQLILLNEFYLAFALLIRKGIKKYLFKKYKPSHIRSIFAKKFQERFGGTKSNALMKLKEFERKLNLKHSAAKKLFKSQIHILKNTLYSFEAIIHLSEKWRKQPTYVNHPILIVNKNSYNKLYSICKKKSKKIDIFLITASSENIPKKYKKPDLNETYSNISNLYNIIQSVQDSINIGQTDLTSNIANTKCKWNHSKKKSKGFKNKLFCYLKPKNYIFHIHYYDIVNVSLFNNLILNLIKYKPNINIKTARPLIIIPVLLGIPEINKQGSILGLSSITQVNKKNYSKKFNNKKRNKRRR